MLRIVNNGAPSEGYERMRVRGQEDFHLANVDLELECPIDLQPLIDEFERDEKALHLYHQGLENNRDFANFELWNYPNPEVYIYDCYNDAEDLVGGADVLISAFCDLIENLPREVRAIWDQCTRREFDIGFQAGNTPKRFRSEIRSETVRRCGEIGAAILITVYPHLNYELRKIEKPKKKRQSQKAKSKPEQK